jgi:hypothetical protein
MSTRSRSTEDMVVILTIFRSGLTFDFFNRISQGRSYPPDGAAFSISLTVVFTTRVWVWLAGMRDVTTVLLFASATLAISSVAIADSNSIGMTMTSDRDPENFASPKSMKYKISGEHEFNNGLVLEVHSNTPIRPPVNLTIKISKVPLATACRSTLPFH